MPERTDDSRVDYLLGGKVYLEQPITGYRAAIDPVLLAAAVDAEPGEKLVDAGLGVGAVSLCLLHRLPEVSVVGIETQAGLAELAMKNAKANGFERALSVVHGNCDDHDLSQQIGLVDQVITNPPFQSSSHAQASPNPSKDIAHREIDMDIAGWIKACRRFLKHKGRITIIYRADRLHDLLRALNPNFGEVTIFPLWPEIGAARPAKRVLVTARYGVKTPLVLLPGLALHDYSGAFVPEVAAILKGDAALTGFPP